MVRLFYPALTSAALHTALLAVYLLPYGGDPSALIGASSLCKGTFPYDHVTTAIGDHGYDGQFYYAIARAPLARHTVGFESLSKELPATADKPAIVIVTNPDYACRRQLRLLYPLVCWALSGGDPVLLFWTMPLVNVLAIGGLAWLGALVACRQGFSPWWGMLLPLAVNVGTPMLRDLTDPLSTCMLASLLVAWLLRGPWWVVALCGTAAMFSREQNTAAVAVVLVCAAWERRWWTCAGLVAALALWSGWVLWLWQTYHDSPFIQRQGNFAWPFLGILASRDHMAHKLMNELRTAGCLLLLAAQMALALDLLRRPADAALRLTALAFLALALVGGVEIYRDWWSFSRTYAGLPLAVWLGCVQTRRLWPLVPLSAYLLLQWEIVLKPFLWNER